MKKYLTLIFACTAIAAAQSPDHYPNFKLEPLALPTASHEAEAMTMEQISVRIAQLDEKVGGYPPRLKDAADRLSTYERWSKVLVAALALRAESGYSEKSATALIALYRQGHNLDVSGSAERAHAELEEALKAFPDSIPINLQASFFYLQINPKYAPRGEKILLHLRELLGSDQNWDVEKGLVFGYLYQERLKEAQAQVEHCLTLRPGDKMMLSLREGLKSGKIGKKTVSGK